MTTVRDMPGERRRNERERERERGGGGGGGGGEMAKTKERKCLLHSDVPAKAVVAIGHLFVEKQITISLCIITQRQKNQCFTLPKSIISVKK